MYSINKKKNKKVIAPLPTNKKLEEISQLVQKALESISDSSTGIWHTTEWNICHHIANALTEQFGDFDIDVELRKEDGRRPDIVIHKRGDNSNNLAIFQVKKNPSMQDIESDVKKIEETFFGDPYNYAYGIFISIGKLPGNLPKFDKERVSIQQVYGWKSMTAEEFETRRRKSRNLANKK